MPWRREFLLTPVSLPGESQEQTEEPGGPESMGSKGVGHSWATNAFNTKSNRLRTDILISPGRQLRNKVTCLRPQSKEQNPELSDSKITILTADLTWRWAASFHLGQVKEALAPGGVRGEVKGLTPQHILSSQKWTSGKGCFCSLRERAWILFFFSFFLLEVTFIQAGLLTWRTGRKVGANSCLRACRVPHGKAFPEENNNSGYQRFSGYRLVKEKRKRKKRDSEPVYPYKRWSPTSHRPDRWPSEDGSKHHILQERIRGTSIRN